MRKLLPTFRDSSHEVWQRLAQELHGRFIEGVGPAQDKVIARVDPWTVTLDVHSEPGYRHETPYTRFRAAYVNPDGFAFNIYRMTTWAALTKLMGTQDIQCGRPEIDRNFILQGNDPQKLRQLLSNEQLCQLLLREPDVHLHVRHAGDWFVESYPEGVDELVLEVEGRVRDLERLERLYELLAETLHTLSHIGSAYESDPKLPPQSPCSPQSD